LRLSHHFPVSLGLMISVWLISACKPADVPRAAPPTSHTWKAEPVLINLFTSAGYTSSSYAWSVMPNLVVYADGRVVSSEIDRQAGQTKRTVLEAQLTSDEVCSLLTQIETDGFFDVSQADYREPGITDNGTTTIEVNAWRTQALHAYALHYAVYESDAGAQVPPALATTYKRLSTYQPPNGQPYQPERIALIIRSYEDTTTAAPLWPLVQPRLGDLLNRAGKSGEVLLEGQEARDLYALWNDDLVRTYIENAQTYQLIVRPLLPLEQYPRGSGWSPAPSFAITPTVEMSCGSVTRTPWPTLSASKPTLPPPDVTDTPVPTPTPNPALAVEAPLKYITSLGRHDKPGQLNGPSGLAFGPNGEIIVGDLLNKRFEWYSPEGTLLHETVITATPISIWDFERMTDGRWYVLGWNRVDVLSPEGQLLQTFKDWPEPPKDRGVSFSTKLAVGPDGTMYIAETRGKRVVILNPAGSLKEIWTGPDNSPLDNIMSLDVDPQGNLYVASDDQNRIVKRTTDNLVKEFQISNVEVIRVMPDESFYAVRNWATITYYAADGKLLQEWGDSRLHYSEDLIGAADGTVVVLSEPYPKIGPAVFRYNATGQPLATFGDLTPQPGQFGEHYAFSASPAGDVWVVEKKNDPFSKEEPQIPTRLVHISSDDQHLGTFETVKDQPFTCDKYALAALTDQTIFLADPCAGKIQHIDAHGQVIQQWGQRGASDDQFNLIRDLTLAPDEKSLYVVDEGNGRISRFSLTGELIQAWLTKDWNIGAPIGLAVDPAGTFYLLDSTSNEIVVQPVQGNGRRWNLPNPEDAVNSIAVDATRQRIYVGGPESYLYVFDVTGSYLGAEGRSDSRGVMLETISDGHLLVSAGYDNISIYEPQ